MSSQELSLAQAINDLLLLGFGASLTLLTQWVFKSIQRREERIEVLALLEAVSQDAARDVGHDERFRHKDAWAKELSEFATAYRRQLPDLYVPLKKVAWQIESSTFSHGQDDSAVYCCDELLNDMKSLELQVLQELTMSLRRKDVWSKTDIKTRARSLIQEMMTNRDGIGPDEKDPRIDSYMKKWRSGEDITNNLRGNRTIGSPWTVTLG